MSGRPFVISHLSTSGRAPIPRTLKEAGIDQFEWESRVQPHRPLWKDFTVGILAGLIIIPPFVLYALPYVAAFLRAVTE